MLDGAPLGPIEKKRTMSHLRGQVKELKRAIIISTVFLMAFLWTPSAQATCGLFACVDLQTGEVADDTAGASHFAALNAVGGVGTLTFIDSDLSWECTFGPAGDCGTSGTSTVKNECDDVVAETTLWTGESWAEGGEVCPSAEFLDDIVDDGRATAQQAQNTTSDLVPQP